MFPVGRYDNRQHIRWHQDGARELEMKIVEVCSCLAVGWMRIILTEGTISGSDIVSSSDVILGFGVQA